MLVALTVNSETLAQLLNGDGPYDDRTVADVQIEQTIRMVEVRDAFMAIAYSAADMVRMLADGPFGSENALIGGLHGRSQGSRGIAVPACSASEALRSP